MNNPTQPNVKLTNDSGYRENYANSVQMRVNIWDFFLVFGTLQQQTETQVEIKNFQGIYLSPQQAKALLGLLQQNVGGYESAFGEIKLDPRKRQGKSRTVVELVRFTLAFGVALAGIEAGAIDQLRKLDFLAGTIAVIALGFGADSIKNLLTQAPKKPA